MRFVHATGYALAAFAAAAVGTSIMGGASLPQRLAIAAACAALGAFVGWKRKP